MATLFFYTDGSGRDARQALKQRVKEMFYKGMSTTVVYTTLTSSALLAPRAPECNDGTHHCSTSLVIYAHQLVISASITI